MAKFSDQVRASDVTFFAFVALICGAVAVLGSNLMGFVPTGWLGGLHASRQDGGTVNQLQVDVAALEAETIRLKQENDTLRQRFTLAEQSTTEVNRRVGTLEGLLPEAIEASTQGASDDIDVSAITATTGPTSQDFDVAGGSVSVTTTPMGGSAAVPSAEAQTMPPRLVAGSGSFGIALGGPLDAAAAPAAWNELNAKVGTLLLGLSPLVGDIEGGTGKRLIAGPIATEADARQLCGLMAKVGIACASVPYAGEPIAEVAAQ